MDVKQEGDMGDRVKRNRVELEDGLIALGPIVFDSPETRSLLIDRMEMRTRRRAFSLKLKTVAVLPGGAGPDSIEGLLEEAADELFIIH